VSAPGAPHASRGVERALADRRRQYEEEVERLLDATFQVMRERDTANPSVADILATSGLSTSVFYRHFPTKDDLLVTLLERAHKLTRRHMEERLARQDDPAARIVEWVRSMFDLLRTDELVTANRPFLLAHPRLLERFPVEIEAGFEALAAPLAAAIADARAASAEGAKADARLAMHHVFGILVDRAALRRRTDDATVDAVASYTLRAVLNP
jgi:AcrR family transcriptional regulator